MNERPDAAPPPETTTPEVVLEDEPIDLADVRADDYLVLVVFWGLAFVVFLQFFTRYVLNDSLGWTEEIARFLLIAVTFIGSIMAVRKGSHIAVELIHRWAPPRISHWLRVAIDCLSIVFYAGLCWLTIELAQRTRQMMVSIDVPKAWLYWGVAACFAVMTVNGVVVLVRRLMGTVPLHEREPGPTSAD